MNKVHNTALSGIFAEYTCYNFPMDRGAKDCFDSQYKMCFHINDLPVQICQRSFSRQSASVCHHGSHSPCMGYHGGYIPWRYVQKAVDTIVFHFKSATHCGTYICILGTLNLHQPWLSCVWQNQSKACYSFSTIGLEGLLTLVSQASVHATTTLTRKLPHGKEPCILWSGSMRGKY